MIEVESLCGRIDLGKQGENLARKVKFEEFTTWKNTFGDGVCELLHQRRGDLTPYPIYLDIEGDNVYWNVSNSDTAIVGEGKCELRYIVNDVVVKSTTYVTVVDESLGDNLTEAPPPQEKWVDDVLNAAAEIKESIDVTFDSIPTKTSELENDSNFATETYVENEIAKFDFIKVVDILPEVGLPNRIYFVPKHDTQTQDLFDEYVWINDKWEWITTKQIEVDLTNYTTKSEVQDGLDKKMNINDVDEKQFTITYEDGTEEVIRSVVFK